jgi:hypothetical protein
MKPSSLANIRLNAVLQVIFDFSFGQITVEVKTEVKVEVKVKDEVKAKAESRSKCVDLSSSSL